MTSPDAIRSRFPLGSASFWARNQLTNTQTPVKSTTTTTAPEHDPHDVTGSRHASKPRIRQDRKGMNATEKEFEGYLRTHFASQPLVFREGLGIRLANGCVYWPDFVVTFNTGCTHIYEVKGFMRDDAAVKLKVAASKFPTFQFFLVTKRAKKLGGGWDIQEVLP